MSDLISRTALLAEYDKHHVGPPGGARKLIEAAPTIDAVPVVRCKDCEYWMYEYDDVGLCAVDVPDVDGVERHASDFCSHGERKENAD